MKEYPHRLDLSDIWYHFEGFPLSHFATIEDDQPRVRMMTLVAYDSRLWLATKTEWDKVEQIRRNPKAELTVPARDEKGAGCVRVTAVARPIEDSSIRQEVSKAIPWFSHYWTSSNDANFTLIGLDILRVLYDHPSDGKKYTVDL
jgi:uncharacterized pyridoxamine 5'-phosphate oxidase family protein